MNKKYLYTKVLHNCSGEQTHVSIRHMHELAQMESCVPEARALVSLHIFRGSPGLRNSIRIPCACSIGGLCAIYASSEGSDES